MASCDFETYSSAGYTWNPETHRWESGTTSGISAVGAPAYAEHPSTEVLCLAYDIGSGRKLWTPADPPPADLFAYLQSGGLIEAHNSLFEFYVWHYVCHCRMGWPALPLRQLRCSMSKARAWGLPGALATVAAILGTSDQKDADGKRLLRKFSVPRQPTKKDPSLRVQPAWGDPDTERLYNYCLQDIATEEAISKLMPQLSPEELELWLLDQQINVRGCALDLSSLADLQALIDQLTPALVVELHQITHGAVQSPSEVAKITGFLAAHSVTTPSLDSDAVDSLLTRTDLPPACRRVLEIRKTLGSASVKKLEAMRRMVNADGRIRDLFQYCGAERTGRFAGRGPQPQNLPSSGPGLSRCGDCGKYNGTTEPYCPHCFGTAVTQCEWTSDAVPDVLEVARSRFLPQFQQFWPDVLGAIAGSLRGLFVASPGYDFVCSDYSAIEAVVLAMLAGEKWREEVFRTHGKIYEMSASKITGIPFEEFLRVKKETGEHHPMRKKVGKVAELACCHACTKVLTHRGWVPILHVTAEDFVHDGVAWVRHGGVVGRGEKKIIDLLGVGITPDHKILHPGFDWIEAERAYYIHNDLLDCIYHTWSLLSWSESGCSREIWGEERILRDCRPPKERLDKLPRGTTAPTGVHEVFDILNAGPRNRFVVLTTEGPLIIHNSGYQGGLGAWRAFGADKFMTDAEIKANVSLWRESSPMIVHFWNGVERAAIEAVRTGRPQTYRDITYSYEGRVLYCRLPSGRRLAYHDPIVVPSTTPWGKDVWKLTHMTNATVGGWQRDDTYGGKLTENIVQATARDILTAAMVRLERAGYRVALHVHDEIVTEVPEGWGSVEEMENIMSVMPPWADGWPIRANGGWRGKRYRK